MARPNQNGDVRRSRAVVGLGRELEHRVQTYTTAAKAIATQWDKATLATTAVGAAGLLLLASVPSEAEVVYTPANTLCQINNEGFCSFNIDLNNDGQADFTVFAFRSSTISSHGYQSLVAAGWVSGAGSSNRAVNNNQAFAADMRPAALIGPAAKFGGAGEDIMGSCSAHSGHHMTDGPWQNTPNGRFLGLKFQIDGETHYGWARLIASNPCDYSITLTGYAYETVADKRIVAGQLPVGSKSDDAIPAAEPATLGVLAAGATGRANRPFATMHRAEGKVGQAFATFGHGFTGTSDVSLNGTPASFTVVSDAYIRVKVPEGATTGYITVTSPSGVLTSNVPFHVIP